MEWKGERISIPLRKDIERVSPTFHTIFCCYILFWINIYARFRSRREFTPQNMKKCKNILIRLVIIAVHWFTVGIEMRWFIEVDSEFALLRKMRRNHYMVIVTPKYQRHCKYLVKVNDELSSLIFSFSLSCYDSLFFYGHLTTAWKKH